MDGPGWLAPRNISPLGRSPSGGHAGHRGPVPHDILGDTETRPWATPLDNSKLSKTHAFRALSTCAKELASKFKPPAGLGSKHGLLYGFSKGSKTHDFRTLFQCTYKSGSEMDGPKWRAPTFFVIVFTPGPAGTRGTQGPSPAIS